MIDYGNLFGYLRWNQIGKIKLRKRTGISQDTVDSIFWEESIPSAELLKTCDAFNMEPCEVSENFKFRRGRLRDIVLHAEKLPIN
jgi:hypothetical protein